MSASADAADDDSAEMPSLSFPLIVSTMPISPLVLQGVQQISEDSSDAEVASITSSSSGRASPMIPANHPGHPGAIATLAASAESPSPELYSCRVRQEDKTTGKRLRFNSNVVIIDDFESKVGDKSSALDCDTSSPPPSTWWSPDDLRSFKESARSTCRKVRKRKAFTTCLDVAYETVSKSSGGSNANNSNKDDDDSHQGEATKEDLMKLLHRGLTKWSTHGHSCRGLERRASVYQFTTRQDDIVQARRAVFQEQARQRSRKRARVDPFPLAAESVTADSASPLSSSVIEDGRTSTDNSPDCDQDAASAATSVQQASLVKTERACLFARMLGEADAAAALGAVPNMKGRRRSVDTDSSEG
eukprot:CAMPEP_0178621044 /NCGR_PEP_ID=MMETSP0698-20121128/5603_1 /TAXON_ID=265572 /ORGANISM="Extubocellulus spinifer, Strain CCMP396" /LENGTH=359 /DNA_ID=CAMNT_0020260051 /DNA_START=178 /DNA_END=1253 /DNA_ORIENTATION=-